MDSSLQWTLEHIQLLGFHALTLLLEIDGGDIQMEFWQTEYNVSYIRWVHLNHLSIQQSDGTINTIYVIHKQCPSALILDEDPVNHQSGNKTNVSDGKSEDDKANLQSKRTLSKLVGVKFSQATDNWCSPSASWASRPIRGGPLPSIPKGQPIRPDYSRLVHWAKPINDRSIGPTHG